MSDSKELSLRSPKHWLHSIRSPVFVFDGSCSGNANDLRALAKSTKNVKVQFFEVKWANHFDVLAPTNRLIAEQLLEDTGPACNLAFTEEDRSKAFRQ